MKQRLVVVGVSVSLSAVHYKEDVCMNGVIPQLQIYLDNYSNPFCNLQQTY